MLENRKGKEEGTNITWNAEHTSNKSCIITRLLLTKSGANYIISPFVFRVIGMEPISNNAKVHTEANGEARFSNHV